jgi:hypothetical protein
MIRAYGPMKQLLWGTGICLMALAWPVHAQDDLPYTTYTNFDQVLEGRNARYAVITRVSGSQGNGHRAYTGFFFYQCLQFDSTGRYLLGMRVYFQNRDVQPTDRGDIGYIDLKDGFKWTNIGETTAWNWQQGARLQWRPRSDEIVWNDRSEDGKSYVCRVYNFRTGTRRTLPRAIYDLSPDGTTALTHDFERMKYFKGTEYVGIEDIYERQYAPSKTGIWKMNMDTGTTELVISLEKMAAIAFPKGSPSSGRLYFFREGWNPSGTRFIAFIKDPENPLADKAFSMTADGTDVRYLYSNPSHHSWQDDNYILDFGKHIPPGGGTSMGGYFLFKDDGTGKAKELLWATKFNGHDSYVPGPGGEWIISDTYVIDGYQYLFMYHRPTKLFVPLAKLKSTAEGDLHRVDLHPRLSRDGRIVSIDATHEGLGRQMYIINISHILDHPPDRRASVQ